MLLVLYCSIISCDSRPERSAQKVDKAPKAVKAVNDTPVSNALRSPTAALASDTLNEVMKEKDIRLNGVLPRYFSLKEFRKALGEPDSTKLLLEEEPCTNIFQEADGSVDPGARYLFKSGSRFECSKEKVAIDEVNFAHGYYLMFKGYRLDGHTTMAGLKQIFPNACKQIGTADVMGDGQVQVAILREDSNNVSDGHIELFIKDGKLYKLHWWFPC
ncbi:hypothetical protein LLH06_13190 [Mucilaginibacter daejeonensis]|uniref:hypothetical protein n=1 Tax=Mucilaginibacter daejeonensis TaxID=398049 RepID=UPI001D171D0F|nr:hypothetical protein [Mucilaginibacter daejeonensis]UEG51916.1 hypothetical protein LLH06_13190 [Mucilaginibacter daejeonensis]